MKPRQAARDARRLTVCALLLGIMLVLGYIEHLLPGVGVPGVKLGLSNSVLIFAVYMLGLPTAFLLMTLKVVLSGLLFSGLQAMAFAFAGGVLSLCGMGLLSRVPRLPPAAVSMAGGLLHNLGQAAMATLIMHVSAPVLWLALLGAGLACGALTGVAAQATMKHLRAAGFSLAPPAGGRRARLMTALLAVVFLLAASGLVWYILSRNQSMTVVAPDEPGPVRMLTLDDLPLPPSGGKE